MHTRTIHKLIDDNNHPILDGIEYVKESSMHAYSHDKIHPSLDDSIYYTCKYNPEFDDRYHPKWDASNFGW